MPCSTTFPSSRTSMLSTSRIVDSLCAITTVVRPSMSRSRASRDCRLADGVEVGGGLVQYQHWGVLENGAGDCDPLPLTARKLHSPLSDPRVVTVRERLDELLGVGLPRGLLNLRVCDYTLFKCAQRRRALFMS